MDREWFALWDERGALLSNALSCRDSGAFINEWARQMHTRLKDLDEKTRPAGVPAETLRGLRRKYALVWPDWEQEFEGASAR